MHNLIQALIFDFDGVLVSSDVYRFNTVQPIAAKYGILLGEELIKPMRGKTTANMLQELIPESPDIINSIVNEYKKVQAENSTQFVAPIDFTVQFIRQYQGDLPIAVASMSSRETIARLTKYFGIFDKFSHITGREEVTKHKPDPEVYLKTAATLKVDPSSCMVFEDTVIGVQAALSANMNCSVVLNNLNDPSEFANLPIHSFVSSAQDLKNTLEKT